MNSHRCLIFCLFFLVCAMPLFCFFLKGVRLGPLGQRSSIGLIKSISALRYQRGSTSTASTARDLFVARCISTSFDGASHDPSSYSYHVPVLRDECCKYLSIKKDGIYVDCTLGFGGHTRAVLERGGRVIGLDQDPDAISITSTVLKDYIDTKRLDIIQTNFRHIVDAVKRSSFFAASSTSTGLVDGVLMDLGISSHQIDEATRGFSFSRDGPLDMRMFGGTGTGTGTTFSGEREGESSTSITAAHIINEFDTTALANILYEYGEETRSRQIAREIVASRPLNTTGDLEKVISRVTPWKHRPKTLARCFQALRIAVNDEIGALEEALGFIHQCMKPGAPLVIISYHSLEDRRVKSLFKGKSGDIGGITASSSSNIKTAMTSSNWIPLFKRAQLPTEEEIARNRRSRSAKVRVALNGIGLSSSDAQDVLAKLSLHNNDKGAKKVLMKGKIGKKQLAKLGEWKDGEVEAEEDEEEDEEEEEEEEEEDNGDKEKEKEGSSGEKKRNSMKRIFQLKK